MPLRGEVTGRDAYIMVEALTFSVEALGKLQIEHRPDNNITDMMRLIDEFVKQTPRLPKCRRSPSGG